MYYSSSSSPKDKAMMLKRYKQRKAGELKALAEEREKLMEGIKQMQDEERKKMTEEAVAKVVSGELSVYSATGLSEEEVDALASGNARVIARRRLLPKAFVVASHAMDHEDPRVALVGAKLAFEASALTKDELEVKRGEEAPKALSPVDEEILRAYMQDR